jgi:hypothetical protein
MNERLYEVRSFVSKEMDIEAACRAGSPINVMFENGEKSRIHLVKVESKINGLHKFTGNMADVLVDGFYGNDSGSLPKKLLAGFGMLKL